MEIGDIVKVTDRLCRYPHYIKFATELGYPDAVVPINQQADFFENDDIGKIVAHGYHHLEGIPVSVIEIPSRNNLHVLIGDRGLLKLINLNRRIIINK